MRFLNIGYLVVLLSLHAMAQNVVQNPTTTQTINQPGSTELNVNRFEKILFADQFSTIDSLIAASCPGPSSSCTIYVPPGMYTGPTSVHSNVSLVAVSAPANFNVVGSWGLSPNNATTQVTFSYSTNLTLTNVQNVYFKGISLDFQNSNHGLVMTSSSYNRFDDVSIIRAGGTSAGQAALTIDTSGSGGATNSIKNTFTNLNILCNQSTGEYCHDGILLQGIQNQNAVTLNTFSTVAITGCIYSAIDMEANSDTNHFNDVEINQDGGCTVSSTASVLSFNVTDPSVDIDADGSTFENLGVTGSFPYHILSGNLDPNKVHYLTATRPAFTLTTVVTGPSSHAAQLFLLGGHIGTSGPEGVGRNRDVSGSCTLSSGACPVLTFNNPYTYGPVCIVSWAGTGFPGVVTGVLSSNQTTTSIEPKSRVSTDNGVVDWICIGSPF
jgi:hypothetical protein